MLRCVMYSMVSLLILSFSANVKAQFGTDSIKTSKGDLKITFLGHASLLFEFDGKVIYADPASSLDWKKMPKADLVLITHDHGDHLKPDIIKTLSIEKTEFITDERSAAQVKGAKVMKNGDETTVLGLKIEAVPAYNIVHMRSAGTPYHPKGHGNGYIFTFGDKRVYVAGDTENIPEMKALKNIDVAFLPMNLPYTMTPEMVADAAKTFKPKILYIYHYRNSDTDKLQELMKEVKGVELRIRKMY